MATSLVVNGVSYLYPDTGDQSWGTVASAWAAAITSGTLQKAGGAFALTADVNFGSSFGLVSKYFTSQASNPASTGAVRLSDADAINWRNHANSADISLGKNTSDQLTWAGNVIVGSSGIVPVAAGGTGIASGTSGGILGFTGSTTIASSGVLTANQLIVGGGAGATPSSLAAGSQYQVLVMGASNPGYGQINLSQSAAVTGTLLAAQFPALTGDVTTTAGSLATAIAATSNGTITTLSALTTASSLASIGAVTSGTWNATTIAVNHGGTGVTSVTTVPAATSFAGWDANKNLTANNHIEGFRTTATAAGTTTLVVGDAYAQNFTGATTQTVVLPVTSTLVLGQQFLITNLSTGAVTVQSSGANTLQAMAANTQLLITVISTSGTGTASWTWTYQAIQNSLAGGGTVTSVAMTVPSFLSVSGTPITTSGTLAVTLSGTALPAASGGTGQTSLSAAFTSLFETVATTLGDLVYAGASGAPTRLAGDTSNTRKFLREQSSAGTAAAPAWDTLTPGDLLFGWLSKTASYTLGASDFGVSFSGSSGAMTATLPTAASVAGQAYKIINNDSTNTVTINTTSAQTVGGRASGDIVLAAAIGDFIEVFSDGSNWQITSKKETKTLTSNATVTGVGATGGATFDYIGNGATVSLTKGTWRVRAWAGMAMGTASASDFVSISTASGLFGADASSAGQIGAPTALSATLISGYTAVPMVSFNTQFGGTAGYGGNSFVQTADCILALSSTTSVYSVLRFSTTGTVSNTVGLAIYAERIW